MPTRTSRLPCWPAAREVEKLADQPLQIRRIVTAENELPEVTDALAGAAGLLEATAGPALRVEFADDPSLPPQGYTLRIEAVTGCERGGGKEATGQRHGADESDPPGRHGTTPGGSELAGVVRICGDALGRWYGLRALADSLRPTDGELWSLPQVAVRDWPELPWRGTVEGFYGPPWTHGDRIDHLRLAGRVRLNTYVYAPKDDPFHRDRWRDPYPAHELTRLAELVRIAAQERVTFVFAISPGLSMSYSDPAETAALVAKARQVNAIGVQHFALLFDDIPPELQLPEDLQVFGAEPGSAGAAHGTVAAAFAQAVAEFTGPDATGQPRVVVCPTDYAGGAPSPYREQLARALPEDMPLWWTGSDIVVAEVTRGDIDEASASYRRPLLLWDNFPVNDFDPARIFLGPLLGRTADVTGSGLRGISANPMIQAAPSALPVATVASWAWAPLAYDSEAAASWALEMVTGDLAGHLAPLVGANSNWPPSAVPSPTIAALTEAAAEDRTARSQLRERLAELAAVDAALAEVAERLPRLAEQLAPWAQAGAAMARAGLTSLDLLEAMEALGAQAVEGPRPADAVQTQVEDVRTAVAEAERHYPNVLRGVILPFAHHAIRRAIGEEAASSGPLAMVVTGVESAPGDDSLSELLSARGWRVRTTAGRAPDTWDDQPDLVVVTRSSDVECAHQAAAVDAPLITWAHLVDLGLATDADMLGVQEEVGLTVEGAELNGSFSPGPLTVHRGPGTLTWGTPGPEAIVFARTVRGKAALTHYPPGSRLADGAVTERGRTALFLGREGMSPWLMTDAGRQLIAGVLDRVLA